MSGGRLRADGAEASEALSEIRDDGEEAGPDSFCPLPLNGVNNADCGVEDGGPASNELACISVKKSGKQTSTVLLTRGAGS